MYFKNKGFLQKSLINSFNKTNSYHIDSSLSGTHEKKQRVKKSTASCSTCANLSPMRSEILFRRLCQILYRMGAQRRREGRLSTPCSQMHAGKQLGKIKKSLSSTTVPVMNILSAT